MSHLPGALLAGAIGGLAAMALAAGGCGGSSAAPEAAPTCDEFPDSVSALSLDADTTAFVRASADLVDLVTNLDASVLDACAGIATDLLVDDTWTAKGPLKQGSVAAEVTEACNQASRAISAALHPMVDAGSGGSSLCGLSVSGGACVVDASAQGRCVAACLGGENCKAPTVIANCPDEAITGVCMGTCKAGATCEGSVDAPATCQGSCAAVCSGECDGTVSHPVACNGTCSGHCTGTCNGSMTSTGTCTGVCTGPCDAACIISQGAAVQCAGECKGTCAGGCKLDSTAMTDCGPHADCTGGCAGTYVEPSCLGRLSQPTCAASANCQASCESSALLQAACASPSVALVCSDPLGADLPALSTTLQANLPALLAVAETQGPLVADAANSLNGVGQAVAKTPASLSAKAVACVHAAGRAASSAQAPVKNAIAASGVAIAAARGGS
jgi:hypothetical protein